MNQKGTYLPVNAPFPYLISLSLPLSLCSPSPIRM